LRVGEAAYKGFFCERRKCDGAPPAVRWRCTAVHGGAQRCTAVQLHRRGARTTEKRFGGLKKGARPLPRIFLDWAGTILEH
jgi:hypothetical protein